MAILTFKVIYADGQEKTTRITPRAETMAEEKFHGLSHGEAALRTVYFLAWASLNRAGQEPDDFETFIDKIADVEDITDKKPVNPTPGAGQPPAPSSG